MVDSQKQESVEHTLQLGDKLFRGLLPAMPRELLLLDLTMPQLKVVLLLFLGGSSRMSVVASSLGVSLATATGIVDRLVERGIVLREAQPGDRRVVLCHLSEKGEKLIGEMWQSARQRAKELLEAIDASKLMLITDTLEALLQTEMVTKEDLPPAAD